MTGSSDRTNPPKVSIDAISYPIVGYEREGDDAVISTVNTAFVDVFGEPPRNVTMNEFLREHGHLEGDTLEQIDGPWNRGSTRAIELRLEGANRTVDGYTLRGLDDAAVENGADGYLVLEPSAAQPGLGSERIASIISHDLRNPLDVAKAHLRAARQTGDADHFEEIERSHDRIERIIQDVLTLARGEQALDVSDEVDVGTVANDAWSGVETADASLAIDDELPTVAADADRLQRLFENLYRNSVEHAARTDNENESSAENQTVETIQEPVTVRVGAMTDGFYVADDGEGIPAEERHRVFEPGYSTSGSESGTGLGLTIVERIADAHGWRLVLTSGSDGGAKFEFHCDAPRDTRDNDQQH